MCAITCIASVPRNLCTANPPLSYICPVDIVFTIVVVQGHNAFLIRDNISVTINGGTITDAKFANCVLG